MTCAKTSCGGRAGYLLEFPLIAFGTGILAGILSPLLPEPWNLVPWALFAVALLAWFLYDRICPGWRPVQPVSGNEPPAPGENGPNDAGRE